MTFNQFNSWKSQLKLKDISWIVRVLWLVAALLPNNLTDTMSSHSQVLRTTMSVELWGLWALVALATWLHHPISLTTARCIVPVVVAHLLVGLPDSSFGVANVIGAACALVALVLIYTSNYGSIHVQAGAYGDERRYLLRVPAPIVMPLILGWGVMMIVVCITPLMLASERYVLGGVGVVLSVGLLWQLPMRLHRLSRRWLVKVPAGWVVHDDLVLNENLLIKKHDVVSMSLALEGSEAIDLTGMTRGVPIEVQLREMTDVRLTSLVAKLLKTVDALHVKAFLIAPSRILDISAP
jgi:hypothetical protein